MFYRFATQTPDWLFALGTFVIMPAVVMGSALGVYDLLHLLAGAL